MYQKSTSIGLRLLQSHQINKEIMINENMQLIDALFSGGVISRNVIAPPAEPSFGDKYIIPNTESEWIGDGGQLAVFLGSWHFISPKVGSIFYVVDEGCIFAYAGDGEYKPCCR